MKNCRFSTRTIRIFSSTCDLEICFTMAQDVSNQCQVQQTVAGMNAPGYSKCWGDLSSTFDDSGLRVKYSPQETGACTRSPSAQITTWKAGITPSIAELEDNAVCPYTF